MDSNTIKIAKSMKCPYVKLDKSYICGTDQSLSLFNIIFLGSDEQFVGTTQELEGKSKPDWVNIRYDILDYDFRNKLKTCLDYHTRVPEVSIPDVRAIREYNEISLLKKTDGARSLKLSSDYLMYLASGINPANKSDSISADIYPYDNISYLIRFNVDKKKYTIHQFIRCHYL